MDEVSTQPDDPSRRHNGTPAPPDGGAERAPNGHAIGYTAAAVAGPGGVAGVRIDTTEDSANVAEWLSRVVTRVGAITGAFAGLVAFLYVIGGAVMWIRFRSAGLPADQAVSLVPRDQLLVIGLRVLVLPALLSGAVFALLAQRQRRRQLEYATWGQVPLRASLCWLGAIVVLGLVVPLTPGALAWPIAAFALWAGWHQCIAEAFRPTDPRTFPLWRAVGLAVLLSAGVSLARQFDSPVQLPSATVQVGDRPSQTGVLVSANSDQVAVGFRERGEIMIFARSQLSNFLVGPTLDRRAPRASLLSRVLKGGAWAATPLELWCGGERYELWQLSKLCRTQPSLADPVAKVEDGTVTTLLACPRQATRGCAGVLRLETADRYKVRLDGQDRFGVVDLGIKPFQIPAGEELRVKIVAQPKAQVLLGAAGAPVKLVATISLDRAGEAVIATRPLEACFPKVSWTHRHKELAGPSSCDVLAHGGGSPKRHEPKPRVGDPSGSKPQRPKTSTGSGQRTGAPSRPEADPTGPGTGAPAPGDEGQAPERTPTPAPEETPQPDTTPGPTPTPDSPPAPDDTIELGPPVE